jgi:4-diphosphocytidyl-2C-methyl-D-erythritol kinase
MYSALLRFLSAEKAVKELVFLKEKTILQSLNARKNLNNNINLKHYNSQKISISLFRKRIPLEDGIGGGKLKTSI